MNYNIPSGMANTAHEIPSIPLVGYRFHPNNEELINNYLKPKLLGHDLEDLLLFAEVNVCKHEPEDLPAMSKINSADDQEWYFFGRRDLKYSKSRRSNRRTKAGFWKPTGKNVYIKSSYTKKVIGIKKTLVFYKSASPKSLRTAWIMNEYDLISDSSLSNPGEYLLFKLKKKLDGKTTKGVSKDRIASISGFEAEPSCNMASDFENQNHCELAVNLTFVESESSHHMASDFENQNSNEPLTNLAQEVSESNHFMVSDFDNQKSNELISNSAYDGGGSCHSISSDFENQNKNELIFNSAYDGSGLLHSMASNYVIQYLDESAYNGIEQSHLAFDSENQDPMEMTFMSPNENWLSVSDLEDPVSPLQRNSLLASDFENQNLEKETDISAPDEGERPVDLENQNPGEKIDMSTLEEGCLPADAPCPESPELCPELWAEIKAFLELEYSLNPLPQPPASTSTEEVPTYTGFGASVCT